MTENHNAPYMSVGELSGAIKRTLEGAFEYVRVRGEISRPSFPASGHVYFTLKDDSHNLGAVIWKGVAAGLDVRPEEGLDVIVTGKITSFSGQSKYQLTVRSIEVAGEGALLKQLEERKRRLMQEGLFDPQAKKPIPTFPRTIGIVTSPTGAVIQDILHRLSDRFGVHVLVWPVLVQGQGSAEQVARAIEGFNQIDDNGDGTGALPRPDILIVARGGGSLEDLMSFNEEIVVRAAAASTIPLISSIGHETDTTLIDFAADRRAPTPTAAAEMATPVLAEVRARLAEQHARIKAAMARRLTDSGQRLTATTRLLSHPVERVNAQAQALDHAHNRLIRYVDRRLYDANGRLHNSASRLLAPHHLLANMTRRFDQASEKVTPLIKAHLSAHDGRLDAASRLLEANSYGRVLQRGFVLVRDADGKALKQAHKAEPEKIVSLTFADGMREAQILGLGDKPQSDPPLPKPKKAPKARKKPPADHGQTELF
ncbi:MAG: exodeoxyribonuclease VII large subunit [Candidatus Puniceispirillaceae bacterium]